MQQAILSFVFYPSFHKSLIHICTCLCQLYLRIFETVHDRLDGCNLALSVLLRSIPLIFRENWITQWAEKRRRAVISYNIEYGVVLGVFSRGVGGEWVSEPKLLFLKENLHTGGDERVREEARDRQWKRLRRKQRHPFRVTRLTSSKWDTSWGIPMFLPPPPIFKSPLSGLHFQSFHVLISDAGREWDHACPFCAFN